MTRTRTQCSQVLNHLQQIGPLTQEDAKRLYGIARLASRISSLKLDQGVKIEREMVKVMCRDGVKATVARYRIQVDDEQPGLLDVAPARRW